MIINPYMFSCHTLKDCSRLLVMIWVSTFFLPAIGVLVMRGAGLITSLQMEERMERVGPMIMSAVLYLWLARNFYHSPSVPKLLSIFVLGAAISLLISFSTNLFYKLSLHAVAMGGWLALTVMMFRYFDFGSFDVRIGQAICHIGLVYWLLYVLFVTGLVGSARLALGAHRPGEVMWGYFVGALGQWIAYVVLS